MTRMLLVLIAAAAVGAAPAAGQTPRQIRVDVQFRQTGTQSRDAAGAAGGVIVSPRGSVRPRGGAGAGSTRILKFRSIATTPPAPATSPRGWPSATSVPR